MAKPRSSASQDLSRRVQEGFGRCLQQARGEGRKTQTTIAKALEVTRASVSNIENGRHRVFLDQVYAAARALGTSVSRLLPDEEEMFGTPAVHMSPNAGIDPKQMEKLPAFVEAAREKQAREKPKPRPPRSRAK